MPFRSKWKSPPGPGCGLRSPAQRFPRKSCISSYRSTRKARWTRIFCRRAAAAPAQEGKHGAQTAEEVITYQIQRGTLHRLLGIAFDGNHYFAAELLRSRLHLQRAAFASRGHFSRRQAQDDGASIRELYVANGFREADVRTELLDDYRGKAGDVFVRFHITEGAQTRVAELKLEGNRVLRDDEQLAVIGSTAGQPYSEFDVSGDRDNILAF